MKRFLLILVLFALFSCNKNPQISNHNFLLQENFVNLTQAREVAASILFSAKDNKTNFKSGASSERIVENIDEFKNEKKQTSFYVINYEGGGFIILSADRRTMPILAFSERNKFEINNNSYPDGLAFWIKDAKKQITGIQKSNIQQTEKEKLAWKNVKYSFSPNEKSASLLPPVEECYEHSDLTMVGPILETKWYQTGGFQDSLPYISCGGAIHAYAGCVPIAMAQVMKYNEYPISYDWSQMPLAYATSTTASLIKDIHTNINNVYPGEPSYDCTGTWVGSAKNMGAVLKIFFGYSSASFGTYNWNTVENDLDNNRPVILSGDDGVSLGHTWVCDGYSIISYYFDDCSGTQSLFLHMNWGWETDEYNAWFSFNNFNPNFFDFNDNKRMLYNIVP